MLRPQAARCVLPCLVVSKSVGMLRFETVRLQQVELLLWVVALAFPLEVPSGLRVLSLKVAELMIVPLLKAGYEPLLTLADEVFELHHVSLEHTVRLEGV